MSSSVCQGLQSCLEPRFVESRFLMLKSAPPIPAAKPCFAVSAAANVANDGRSDMGGWSFVQSLADARDSVHDNKVYVHPLVKRSASMLSEKSLEMCTESLGSETGSEVSDDISLLVLETSPKPMEIATERRKMRRTISFPPPLTSYGVRVRSHREDGRLLLEAVRIQRCCNYFHEERSEGRLKLSIFKDAEQEEQENEHGQVLCEEEEEEDSYSGEDMEGNNGMVGGEMETGKKMARISSSCKQSGRGNEVLMNYETFWVAT